MITTYSRFAFAALLCCGMFLLHSNARAQCPDSTFPGPNPDSIPWVQDSLDYTIPGTACSIWVYYCDRVIGFDTVQGWLDGVMVDSNTDCDSLSDSTLTIDAQLGLDTIVADKYTNLLEPCFKGSYTIIQAYSPQCWTPQNVGPGRLFIAPCVPDGPYCEKVCQACWNPVARGIVFQNCEEYSFGIAACAGGAPWIGEGCFLASCAGFFIPPGPYIETPLGVDTKTPVDTSMQAYPNPASGSLIVTSAISGEQVQILDVLGREVMHGIIPTNGSLVLDVSSLSAGTYYVSAGHSEVKFIKN